MSKMFGKIRYTFLFSINRTSMFLWVGLVGGGTPEDAPRFVPIYRIEVSFRRGANVVCFVKRSPAGSFGGKKDGGLP